MVRKKLVFEFVFLLKFLQIFCLLILDKTQRMVQKEDEVIFLRGQLKRMEILLQNKNAKIQELMDQVERQKPYKKTTI